MTKQNKVFFAVIALLILIGFATCLFSLQNVNQSLKDLTEEFRSFRELVIALDSTAPAPITTSEPAKTAGSKNEQPINAPASPTTDIPTSIIFSTMSSPLLLPQSNLTITLEKAGFAAADHTVTLHLKIFTSETDSFNALEPTPLFALFDKNTGELKQPAGLNGSFDSLPPRSAIPAQIIFSVPADQSSFIFKIGGGDQAKFYEFNFDQKTYKETTVG